MQNIKNKKGRSIKRTRGGERRVSRRRERSKLGVGGGTMGRKGKKGKGGEEEEYETEEGRI